MHKGFKIGKQRLDMVVDDVLVVEGKSTYKLPERATRQLYNYVRAMNVDVALLLHFGPDPQFFRVMPIRPNSRSGIQNEGEDG